MRKAKIKIDQTLKRTLEERRLFLEPIGPGEFRVCLDDGKPGGFEIGRAVFHTEQDFMGRSVLMGAICARNSRHEMYWHEPWPTDVNNAIRSILRIAHYDDILRAMELSSGTTRTYTADVGEERAEWLAGLDEPEGMTNLGGGKVRLTESAVSFLRAPHPDQLILTVTDGDLLIIDIDGYPLTLQQ